SALSWGPVAALDAPTFAGGAASRLCRSFCSPLRQYKRCTSPVEARAIAVRLCLMVEIDVGLPAARTPHWTCMSGTRARYGSTLCCERVWLRRAIMYNARHGTHAIRGFAAGAAAAAAW